MRLRNLYRRAGAALLSLNADPIGESTRGIEGRRSSVSGSERPRWIICGHAGAPRVAATVAWRTRQGRRPVRDALTGFLRHGDGKGVLVAEVVQKLAKSRVTARDRPRHRDTGAFGDQLRGGIDRYRCRS